MLKIDVVHFSVRFIFSACIYNQRFRIHVVIFIEVTFSSSTFSTISFTPTITKSPSDLFTSHCFLP